MKRLSWLLVLVLLAFSCQEFQLDEEDGSSLDQSNFSSFSSSSISINGVNCFETKSFPLLVNGAQVGTVSVSIDDANITVSYNLLGTPYFLLGAGVYAGSCTTIP